MIITRSIPDQYQIIKYTTIAQLKVDVLSVALVHHVAEYGHSVRGIPVVGVTEADVKVKQETRSGVTCPPNKVVKVPRCKETRLKVAEKCDMVNNGCQ